MKAEIINVGTELLIGSVLNTHQQYLARACASLGLNLYRISTVGDNQSRLAQAMAERNRFHPLPKYGASLYSVGREAEHRHGPLAPEIATRLHPLAVTYADVPTAVASSVPRHRVLNPFSLRTTSPKPSPTPRSKRLGELERAMRGTQLAR